MSYRLRQLLALMKEYPFVTTCLIIILIAGNLSVFLNLKNTELEHVQNRVRQEGAVVQKTINASPALRSDSQLIESALKEIDASLVTEDNLAENYGYFYIIEDQSQAQMGELHQNTAPPNEPEAKYRTVPLSLTVKGTYSQVFNFLHRVETGSRLIKIASFTMHRSQPTGDAVTLAMELNMLAYP